MTLKVAMASVKGASGVSTAAHLVAASAAAQGPVTLVEADPSGGSLLSWCDQLHAGAGDLYDAAMSRDPGGLTAVVQRVGDVAVVPSWGRPFRTVQALMRPRVPWDLLFGEIAGSVIVDVGRLYPDAPTLGLLQVMDVIVLVTASEPGPVAATMQWAGQGGRHGSDGTGVPTERIALITNEVVGRRRGVSVTPSEMASLQGPPYVGHLGHDDAAIDLLRRGASAAHRSLRRRPVMDAAGGIAAWLSTRSTAELRGGVR